MALGVAVGDQVLEHVHDVRLYGRVRTGCHQQLDGHCPIVRCSEHEWRLPSRHLDRVRVSTRAEERVDRARAIYRGSSEVERCNAAGRSQSVRIHARVEERTDDLTASPARRDMQWGVGANTRPRFERCPRVDQHGRHMSLSSLRSQVQRAHAVATGRRHICAGPHQSEHRIEISVLSCGHEVLCRTRHHKRRRQKNRAPQTSDCHPTAHRQPPLGNVSGSEPVLSPKACMSCPMPCIRLTNAFAIGVPFGART